jgi:hypothetical protein
MRAYVPMRMGAVYSTPSSLNAHWTLDSIAAEFAAVRATAENQDHDPERAAVRAPAKTAP